MATSSAAGADQPRAYQQEMLRASLRENIIVAMDTGSGKTKVAVMRIAEELQRCPADQLCWFLCPNVELAKQQHRVLDTQLAAVPCRLLLGKDGVEYWRSVSIWEAVLRDQRVVVSTFQVLFDALNHGFVKMSKLALLVIDEAHHCVGNTPLSRIMNEHYHSLKRQGEPVPAILGLTATPTMKAKVKDLPIIEQKLDAISRTPKASIEDLLKHVHRPEMTPVKFNSASLTFEMDSYDRFANVFANVHISDDPYVQKLDTDGETDPTKLKEAMFKKRTWCHKQLRSIDSNASTLRAELGPWASNRFFIRCRQKFQTLRGRLMLDAGASPLYRKEVDWLIKLLHDAHIPENDHELTIRPELVAHKAFRLIEVLEKEMSPSSAAIVFVQTKATVYYLSQLLDEEAYTKKLLKVGRLVGLSNNTERANEISEILEFDNRKESSLVELKNGTKNLLVCTNVAEEGLDISSCNVVICYDRPQSLKSFVQRRGRARAKDSKFLIFFDEAPGSSEGSKLKDFMEAEKQMKQMYADDMRVLEKQQEKENQASQVLAELRSKSGTARITANDAVAHIHRFCDMLPRSLLGNAQPSYSFEDEAHDQVRCTIILPNTVDSSLRRHTSEAWPTERQAKRDAALVAYRSLYEAGLLNENLLPIATIDDDVYPATSEFERREGIVQLGGPHDPYRMLTTAWASSITCYQYACSVPSHQLRVFMLLPFRLSIPSLPLILDQNRTIEVQFELRGCSYTSNTVGWASQTTRELLWSIFRSRMEKTWSRFPVYFSPTLDGEEALMWLTKHIQLAGLQKVLESGENALVSGETLIRQRGNNGKPIVFTGFAEHEAVTRVDDRYERQLQDCVKGLKMSARTDLIHPINPDAPAYEDAFSYIPIQQALVDSMPRQMIFFASLIPSIMHHVGRGVLGQHLCAGLLAPTGITDISLVLEAITATAARENVNYQHLEFLGDAVLGFSVAISLLAEYPLWHEGYLTPGRSHVVSNNPLSRVAERTGLTSYILTTQFTGLKWAPPHNEQYEDDTPQTTKSISTKTMADVVESLIGVAYLTGGMDAAFTTVKTLIGPVKTLIGTEASPMQWSPLHSRIEQLQSRVTQMRLPSHLEPMQELLGYRFQRPALLIEAITHNSYTSESTVTSYERLEFAGDSILSLLVTQLIFTRKRDLPVEKMHLIRTAAVNAHFLALKAMSLKVSVTRPEHKAPNRIDPKQENGGCTIEHKSHDLSLNDFILHFPTESFTTAKSASIARFHAYRSALETDLAGPRYPWTLLSAFAPEKFFSDIVESLLCAIFIDSSGDLSRCLAFLHALGVVPFVEHALDSGMQMLQPKQELNMLTGSQETQVSYNTLRIGEAGEWEEVAAEMRAGELGFACRVYVGEELVATACGRGRFEAETRAAERALVVWKGRVEGEDVEMEMGG